MKYLLLIIRHIWPRKIWKDIAVTHVEDSNGIIICGIVTQRDQFGNLRTFKIKN
jgi:hypothetical protein